MKKRIAFAVFGLLLCASMIYGCIRAVPAGKWGLAPTPEPVGEITIGEGWMYDGLYNDIVFFEGLSEGCVCGEPRDDGRLCDVYIYIVSEVMMEVWSDASPEELESIVGVEWAEGRALGRDPRYGWQGIVDGICAFR